MVQKNVKNKLMIKESQKPVIHAPWQILTEDDQFRFGIHLIKKGKKVVLFIEK